MLDYLRIRGLALLDDVALEFEPGMNVLTGETGAGKSIIVDALTLLRGGRARAELVREGDEAAHVEAQFSVRGGVEARLGPLLAERELVLEDGALVVARRVRRSGRSRASVQSGLTTLAILAEIGAELLEICSQHEHHSLTQVGHHLELLDAHAGLDGAEGPLQRYGEAYREWRALDEKIADIREREADRLQRADYLRFQIEEIERVGPSLGEHDELRARLTLLKRVHELGSFADEARERLYESDDAVAASLGTLLDRARRLPTGMSTVEEISEQLEAAQIACEEAAAGAARLADELEVGPGELEATHERLHELDRLRRKHSCEVDELVERRAGMSAELEGLDSAEQTLAGLEEREAVAKTRCALQADALHDARGAATQSLARAIEVELAALHIPSARLEVELAPLPEGGFGPRGRDRAELRFSANPGEPLASLTKVASGGELSRVLLAVKSVLSTEQRVATYVFDEVDAGVGGAVAEAIGSRLRKAAGHHQVLCITHLPQIAAFADAHFRVEKQVLDGRTVTRVVRLDAEQRVEELARMLGGKRVTASAKDHARALIAEAQGSPRSQTKAKAKVAKAKPAKGNKAKPTKAKPAKAKSRAS